MALGLEILSEPMLHTRYWARQLGNRKMNLPLSPQRDVRHVVNYSTRQNTRCVLKRHRIS